MSSLLVLQKCSLAAQRVGEGFWPRISLELLSEVGRQESCQKRGRQGGYFLERHGCLTNPSVLARLEPARLRPVVIPQAPCVPVEAAIDGSAGLESGSGACSTSARPNPSAEMSTPMAFAHRPHARAPSVRARAIVAPQQQQRHARTPAAFEHGVAGLRIAPAIASLASSAQQAL